LTSTRDRMSAAALPTAWHGPGLIPGSDTPFLVTQRAPTGELTALKALAPTPKG